jgi:hypothetical protein
MSSSQAGKGQVLSIETLKFRLQSFAQFYEQTELRRQLTDLSQCIVNPKETKKPLSIVRVMELHAHFKRNKASITQFRDDIAASLVVAKQKQDKKKIEKLCEIQRNAKFFFYRMHDDWEFAKKTFQDEKVKMALQAFAKAYRDLFGIRRWFTFLFDFTGSDEFGSVLSWLTALLGGMALGPAIYVFVYAASAAVPVLPLVILGIVGAGGLALLTFSIVHGVRAFRKQETETARLAKGSNLFEDAPSENSHQATMPVKEKNISKSTLLRLEKSIELANNRWRAGAWNSDETYIGDEIESFLLHLDGDLGVYQVIDRTIYWKNELQGWQARVQGIKNQATAMLEKAEQDADAVKRLEAVVGTSNKLIHSITWTCQEIKDSFNRKQNSIKQRMQAHRQVSLVWRVLQFLDAYRSKVMSVGGLSGLCMGIGVPAVLAAIAGGPIMGGIFIAVGAALLVGGTCVGAALFQDKERKIAQVAEKGLLCLFDDNYSSKRVPTTAPSSREASRYFAQQNNSLPQVNNLVSDPDDPTQRLLQGVMEARPETRSLTASPGSVRLFSPSGRVSPESLSFQSAAQSTASSSFRTPDSLAPARTPASPVPARTVRMPDSPASVPRTVPSSQLAWLDLAKTASLGRCQLRSPSFRSSSR